MNTPPPPTAATDDPSATRPAHRWRRRGGRVSRPAAAVIARGEPTLWLTAGALATALFMIVGLIVLVVVMGGRTFWPARLVRVDLVGERALLGEVTDRETYILTEDRIALLPEAERDAAKELLGGRSSAPAHRTLFRVDNKPLTGETYEWISDFQRAPDGISQPEWAVTVERTSWGRFLGIPDAFTQNHPRPSSGEEDRIGRLITFFETNAGSLDDTQQETLGAALERLRDDLANARTASTELFLAELRSIPNDASRIALLETGDELPLSEANAELPIVSVRDQWSGAETAWSQFEAVHGEVRKQARRIHKLDRHGLARISDRIEQSRMQVVQAGLDAGRSLLATANRLVELDAARDALDSAHQERIQFAAATSRHFGPDAAINGVVQAIVDSAAETATAERRAIDEEIASLEEMIPATDAVDRFRSVSAESRRQIAEITGDMAAMQAENDRTVWSLVTADGVTQEIPIAEVVRAFPANQLDFFGRLRIYLARWSEFLLANPREANTEGGVFPAIWGTVAMTLIMTLAVVPFGVLAALYLREYAKAGTVVSAVRIAVNNLAGVPSIVFGVFGLGFFCYVVGARVDEVFYPAYVSENRPVFGTGGLFWASLTLALLTLPVVIVATEEALAAVPNSMREGAYACGSSKWQTIRRIVLPQALPGVMTGMILAMARGAGEVAPLMLVGAVKVAPELPIDGTFPFLHPSRSFMHLGFHIYDLGFQSPDSEAAKPMVFTTTLLLITIVAVLNITAIRLRSHLRKRYATSQF